MNYTALTGTDGLMIKATPTEQTALPDGLIDALVQASFTVTAVLTRVGAENDLSLTQLRVLAILRDRRVRMSALADYLGLEKSTMSGLVARAETRSLLARAANAEDGRVVEVFLTARGARLATRLYRQVAAELAPVLLALAPADRLRLQVLLERMLRTPTA